MSMTTRHQRGSSQSQPQQQSLDHRDKENDSAHLGDADTADLDIIENSQAEVSPAKTHAQSAMPASSSAHSRPGPRFGAPDNKRKRSVDARRDASAKKQQTHGPAFDKDKQSLSAHTSSLSVEDIQNMFERALSRTITGSPNVKSQAAAFRPIMGLITTHSNRSEDQKQIAVALSALKVRFDIKDYDDLKLQARDKKIRHEMNAWLHKDGASHSAGVAAILEILDKNVSVPASPAKSTPAPATAPLSPFAIVLPLLPVGRRCSVRKSPVQPSAKQQLHFPAKVPPPPMPATSEEPSAVGHDAESSKVVLEEPASAPAISKPDHSAPEPLSLHAEEAPAAEAKVAVDVPEACDAAQGASGTGNGGDALDAVDEAGATDSPADPAAASDKGAAAVGGAAGVATSADDATGADAATANKDTSITGKAVSCLEVETAQQEAVDTMTSSDREVEATAEGDAKAERASPVQSLAPARAEEKEDMGAGDKAMVDVAESFFSVQQQEAAVEQEEQLKMVDANDAVATGGDAEGVKNDEQMEIVDANDALAAGGEVEGDKDDQQMDVDAKGDAASGDGVDSEGVKEGQDATRSAEVNPEGTQAMMASKEPQSQPDEITKDDEDDRAEEVSSPKAEQINIPPVTALPIMTPPTASKISESSGGAGCSALVVNVAQKMTNFESPAACIADPFEAQKMHELGEMERQYIAAREILTEKERLEQQAIEQHAEIKKRLLEVQQEYKRAQTNMKNTRRDRIVANVIAQEQAEELQQGMQELGQLMSSFEQEKSRMGQLTATLAMTPKP